MKAYKGFDKNMQCRGFQFEEGKTYETEDAKLCESGFHACTDPLDVFAYYSPDTSVYHEVELYDVSKESSDDSKVCGKKITIGARIGIKDLVTAFVGLVLENTRRKTGKSDGAKIGSSGDWAKIGSSGDWAKIGSSGDGAKIGSSGDGAKIGSSGDRAKIGSSGDRAKIGVTGRNSVVMCAGNGSKAKAALGCWITLAEWANIDNEYTPVCVRTGKIDGVNLNPNTWYKLENGEFVEAYDE